MLSRFSLFLATALVLTANAAWAQRASNESASQNVRESEAFDRLVCSNPSFRAKRIAQECGPITDPELHQSCLSTFDCGKAPRAPNYRRAPPSETVR
jgi:hypothetical protein